MEMTYDTDRHTDTEMTANDTDPWGQETGLGTTQGSTRAGWRAEGEGSVDRSLCCSFCKKEQ